MPPIPAAQPGVPSGEPELRAALGLVRREVWWAFGFGFVASLLALAPSWYMLEVYDRVVNSRSGLTLSMLTLAVLLACALIQAQEWTRWALLRAAAERFEHTLEARSFFAALEASRQRAAGGAGQAAQDLRTLREFFTSPVLPALFEVPMVTVFVLLLFAMSPWLALVTAAAAALQLLIGLVNERSTGQPLRDANRRGWAAQLQADRLLQNAQVIQAMGMLPQVHARWNQRQQEALILQTQASRAGSRWQTTGRLLQNTLSSGLLGLSCWLLLRDQLHGGGAMLILASIFGGRAVAPLVQLVTQWPTVVGAREAWARISQLLKSQPALPAGMPLPPPKGALAVEQVSAAAPGSSTLLLRDLQFALAPGEVLVVIGASGAGKSVLARVLLGLWPASAGKVRLDGVDIAGWPKTELGPHIGYLPQGVDLLDGSLAQNISRFGSSDPLQLSTAVEAADLHELAQSLPQGLDTRIGPEGARLSGGQRQRVGLARAVYGQPGFVVLDEPNANLDEAGDAALAQLIDSRKRRGVTFVVMSHRASVLAVADKVLLLHEGRQQAFGPRDAVMAALRQAREAAQGHPPPALRALPAAASPT